MLFLKKSYDFISESLENVFLENVFQSITEKTSFVKSFDEEIQSNCIIILCSYSPGGPTHRAGAILGASITCEQAEPEEQGTTDQECDGQLNDDPVRIAGQEEEEETAEQHAETNAHESTNLMFEGPLRYEFVAGLAGRTLQVLKAEALLTSWTNGARHRTAGHLTAAFGHDLAPSEGPCN